MTPAIVTQKIPAMSESAIDAVRAMEHAARQLPQVRMTTHHLLHGGMYSRTIIIPAGVAVTGSLVKVPTALIICGHVWVYTEGDMIEINGYRVIPASSNRKTAVVAHKETAVTMIFATEAKTIEQAEAEFADDISMLASHDNENIVVITGE